MTVEELMALLKEQDPKATLYYVLGDNNKVRISNVVMYKHNKQDMPGVAFYLKTKGTVNGMTVEENI